MSINSELTRLDAVRDALVSSVNGKGGNLAADATLWQVKAAVDGIEVGSGEDPTPIVTQPAPEVSIDKATGKVTAAYTPVAGKVTDTSKKSATLQLTVQGAQTITPGKTSQTVPADRYLTGVQTIAGDNNLSAENIKNGVSIFGVSGKYTGDAVEVTQPKPTVSVNSSNGLVTAKYTPVAGLVKDTAEKSGTLQLTAQAAQTITPGTSNKTIAAGRYLTGTQTIKGDSNLVAGNIKKGVSVFGVAGSYEGEGSGGGVGGAFDLVKVTEYTPYQAPFSGITKVTFSGFGYDEMSGMDFSAYNGDWLVENSDEPDPLKRTFKRDDRYLYFFPDPDNNWGGDAWCINSNKQNGGYNAELYYNSTTELTNGTINWYAMMGSATTQCTVTKTNYPEVQFVLKGQKATAYDPATKTWTFDSSILSFSATEKTLSLNGIYASTGTMLIGNKVAFGGDMPTAGMLLYIPFDNKVAMAETGQALEYSGSQSFTPLNGIPCMKIDSGYVKTTANSGITGSQSRSFSFWAYPTTGGTYVNAVGCGNERSQGRMFNCGVRTDGTNVRAEFTTWGWDLDSVVCSADGKLHHFVYVFDQSNPTKVLVYVDGIFALTHTVGDVNTSASPFWIGQSGGGEWNYTGYLASVRCYNRVLTEDEIAALAAEYA